MTTSRIRIQLGQAKREQSAAHARLSDAHARGDDAVTVGWFNARRCDADKRVNDLEFELRETAAKR